jgi:hypothetical protein
MNNQIGELSKLAEDWAATERRGGATLLRATLADEGRRSRGVPPGL